MKPQIHTLKNGLNVMFVDTKAYPSLTTLLLLDAGSRYETKENNGIAHFLEHMPFKGSKKYPTAYAISATMEGLGAISNAFTSKDYVGYWAKGPAQHFETLLDVITDVVLHPLLVAEEIEREKGVIIEEINMYDDRPDWMVAQYFDELLYKDTPLGRDTLGTRTNIKSFSRKTFTDFRETLYYPTNAVLVVAGGLNKQDYLGIIEQKFSDWEGDKKVEYEKVIDEQNKTEIFIKNKKTEQVHFCLGFRTFSQFDQRKDALSILSAILGGGAASRLFTEVRERRGLCYYIHTYKDLHADVGNMVTQAGVTKDLDKVKEAITVILKEHRKMTEGDIKKEEFERAREMLKGRLLLSLEDSFSVASFFGSRKLLEHIIETPEEAIKKLEKVTLDEVAAVAEDVFRPENLSLSLIGPFEKEDITVKDLEL